MEGSTSNLFTHYAQLANIHGGAYQEIHEVLSNPTPVMLLAMWLEWCDQMAYERHGDAAYVEFSAHLRALLEEVC